jgi:hypothetical protein
VVADVLSPLDLPAAPPVTRAAAAAVVRPRLPAVTLLCLGVVLTIGPIVGGLFSKVAAGKQMVDQFAPYITTDTLARYDRDIATMRNGAAAVDSTYATKHVKTGRFPRLDEYQARSTAIDDRAGALLRQVSATQSDYQKVAAIGGFDRVPFLIVIAGAVAIYGGCVLRFGARRRARSTVLLVVAVSALTALYPFVSNFERGATSGRQMLGTLSPVMTPGQVQQLQSDFIVLVTAVDELDTSFRTVPHAGPGADRIRTLVHQWPTVSSDFASLVGTINDNVTNYNALESLDSLTNGIGFSGLEVFPWVLVGVGAAIAMLSAAALPRRKKELA